MRLLEFVPCARPAALPEDSAPSPRLTRAAAAAPPLSPTTCAYPEKRRRRPSLGSASPWRPSLVAISEDGISAAADAKGAGRRGGSRMARVKSAGAGVPRTGGDDFRNYGVPPVMLAFAPTAFLF